MSNFVIAGRPYLPEGLSTFIRTDQAQAAAHHLLRRPAYGAFVLSYLFEVAAAPIRQTPEFWALMEREGLSAHWREGGLWPDFCQREPACEPYRVERP